MIKGIANAKGVFRNLHHVTCLAHSLHRVSEFIRSKFLKTDKFISTMKKVLRKSPLRRQNFKEVTKINLPPNPVVTRWGSW